MEINADYKNTLYNNLCFNIQWIMLPVDMQFIFFIFHVRLAHSKRWEFLFAGEYGSRPPWLDVTWWHAVQQPNKD